MLLAGRPDAKRLTVTYHSKSKSGTLTHGQSIDGEDDMVFNAVA